MPRQNIISFKTKQSIKRIKTLPKLPLSSFCIHHLLLGMKPFKGLYTQWEFTGKSGFFPLRVVIIWVKDESLCLLPLFTLRLHLTWGYVGLVHAATFSVRSYVFQLFSWCLPSPMALTKSTSSSVVFLNPDGEIWWRHSIYSGVLQGLSRCPMPVVVPVFAVIYCIISDDAWARHWSVCVAKCH